MLSVSEIDHTSGIFSDRRGHHSSVVDADGDLRRDWTRIMLYGMSIVANVDDCTRDGSKTWSQSETQTQATLIPLQSFDWD